MARVFRWAGSPYVRLTLYYAAVVTAGFLLVRAFPSLESAFNMERLRETADIFSNRGVGTASDVPTNPLTVSSDALVAILGALLLLAPVAWVYMLTKKDKGYDESVVHTVLILPVPVTGLVIVIQHSVALAFSIAGIVAAVRFRNTLEDTKDAVYIFLAIGTALAAGGQALGIALVTSIIFNYLVLFMWHHKIGNIEADALKGRAAKLMLGEVLVGATGSTRSRAGSVTVGDPNRLVAATPASLAEVTRRKARLRDHMASAGHKKYNGLLVVLADANEQCLAILDEVLKECTERFKLVDVTRTEDGTSTLEYLIGLPKNFPPKRLATMLESRASDHIVAAEFQHLNAS